MPEVAEEILGKPILLHGEEVGRILEIGPTGRATVVITCASERDEEIRAVLMNPDFRLSHTSTPLCIGPGLSPEGHTMQRLDPSPLGPINLRVRRPDGTTQRVMWE